MVRVYIMRHGESLWNAERKWAGHADPDLSPRGEEEALDACEAIRRSAIKCITSSPLKRARRTAMIISEVLGIPMKEPITELSERNSGAIRGLTSAEIEARFPGLLDRWRACEPTEIPGGEPWSVFVRRVEKGILGLLRIGDSPIVAVTHEGAMRAINCLLNEPQRQHANCEGRWLAVDGKRIGT